MIRIRATLIAFLVASILHVSPINASDLDNAACPGPPVDLARMYLDGNYVLDNVAQDAYPYSSFAVFVDKHGTGHLQSYCVTSAECPRPATNNLQLRDNLFVDWQTRLSFLDKKRGWIMLSFPDARRLWGSFRDHGDFMTFDGKSVWNEEPNIYHLDLKFDKSGIIVGYRIRGIGICNPQWVFN